MTKKLHYLVAIALLLSPIISFGQAPNLGTAAKFVLFTTNGAVLNTGITHLTGDVGTQVGSNTGFGNVNGVMHSNDTATLQTVTDLLAVYTQLDTITATDTLVSLLGNGLILGPGVHHILGNAALSNILTLDGQGDSNSVFIFQVEGTFISAAAAQVVLINGAVACNVFWKTENVVTLSTNTVMKGTIVANNAAINMGIGVNLVGRALSIAGAITINGITGHTPSGCGSLLLTGPIAPSLGAIECYALFSGIGPVDNAGVTNVTGDVGTNSGLTTDYDSLLVQGAIHPIPDFSTAAAATALTTTSTYLDSLPYDIQLLYPAQFGGDLVLTPHTYWMGGAVTFIGNVYLDAENDPNAVFVIRVNGAVTTGTFSKVILINGAQAANVYWRILGAVVIMDSSTFKGTIVSNGAIDLRIGTDMVGRALTNVGALNTIQASVVTPPSPCSPLSVTWLSFNGKLVQQHAFLEWTTTGELNNGFFTLDKSNDGKTFETVTTVNASSGIGAGTHYYSFNDPKPYTYYRISQTDNNGEKKYYRIISLSTGELNTSGTASLYPNPFSGSLSISITDASATNSSELSIYNVLGTLVLRTTITQQVTDIKTGLPAGVYYYKVVDKDQKVQSGKLVSIK